MKLNQKWITAFAALTLYGVSSSAYADEPKAVKGDSKTASAPKTSKSKVASESTNLPARQMKKDQSQPKPREVEKAVGGSAPDKSAAKSTDRKQRGAVESSTQNSKAESHFVDRDGDGLRDGQESRFRGRYRRDNSSGREATTPQRAIKYRFGIGGTTTPGRKGK